MIGAEGGARAKVAPHPRIDQGSATLRLDDVNDSCSDLRRSRREHDHGDSW